MPPVPFLLFHINICFPQIVFLKRSVASYLKSILYRPRTEPGFYCLKQWVQEKWSCIHFNTVNISTDLTFFNMQSSLEEWYTIFPKHTSLHSTVPRQKSVWRVLLCYTLYFMIIFSSLLFCIFLHNLPILFVETLYLLQNSQLSVKQHWLKNCPSGKNQNPQLMCWEVCWQYFLPFLSHRAGW